MPPEMSVGQAAVGVADVLAEEVVVAARVASEDELLAEAEGLPRAVQLYPPVLSVMASQPVMSAFALV